MPNHTPDKEIPAHSAIRGGFSLYLDAVRLAAALMVVASHLAYARYTNGQFEWVRNLNIGSDAVVIFFVLSGFVIAHTTHSKSRPAHDYATARLARLYSVVLPAIVLTVCLDTLGAALFPDVYAAHWYNGDQRIAQIIAALSFMSQGWGGDIRLGTNGPFWSVAYEAWYYAAFGVAVYCKGRSRTLLLAAMALIAGPRILLLAPCWLIGVGLQRGMQTSAYKAIGQRAALAMLGLPLALYVAAQAIDVPNALTGFTRHSLGGTSPNDVFGFSDEFVWNFLISCLVALHFAGAARLLRAAVGTRGRVQTIIRWGAGATFSIYLFHNPILSFLHALPIYNAANPVHWAVLATTTLAACLLLAEVSERRLPAWKTLVSRLLSGMTRQPA